LDGVTDPNVVVLMPGIRRFLEGARVNRARPTSDLRFLDLVSCSDRNAVVLAEGLGRSVEVIYVIDNPVSTVADSTGYINVPTTGFVLANIAHRDLSSANILMTAFPQPSVNVVASQDVIADWAARGLFAGPLSPRPRESMLRPVLRDDQTGTVFTGHGVVADDEPRLRLRP